MNSKINKSTTKEFFVTLAALSCVIGFLALISQGLKERSSSVLLKRVAEEVMRETPKIIYALGSSVTGSMLAAGFFIKDHPTVTTTPLVSWFLITILFGIVFLILGAALSFLVK